ncbi:MAG: hypothetical protein KW793_00755 [Candidatus Doudnabacteria bacterium]|nr:hypothetical protein [Candidatus Doudnabacteria bacterium]
MMVSVCSPQKYQVLEYCSRNVVIEDDTVCHVLVDRDLEKGSDVYSIVLQQAQDRVVIPFVHAIDIKEAMDIEACKLYIHYDLFKKIFFFRLDLGHDRMIECKVYQESSIFKAYVPTATP